MVYYIKIETVFPLNPLFFTIFRVYFQVKKIDTVTNLFLPEFFSSDKFQHISTCSNLYRYYFPVSTLKGDFMAQKLYVGNLSFNVTEEQLRTHFSEFGEVLSANIITDSYSGHTRGFGFVEMENHEAAISALNGKEFDGRPLTVNIARERPPKRNRGNFNNWNSGNFRGRNRY